LKPFQSEIVPNPLPFQFWHRSPCRKYKTKINVSGAFFRTIFQELFSGRFFRNIFKKNFFRRDFEMQKLFLIMVVFALQATIGFLVYRGFVLYMGILLCMAGN
jgi:hypothetical protein